MQISGAGFTGATVVNFGSVAATSVQVDSDQAVTAIAPAELSKTTVQVTVTTPLGTSPVDENGANDYTFVSGLPAVTSVSPDFGLTTGGQSVTITGFGFVHRGQRASAGRLRWCRCEVVHRGQRQHHRRHCPSRHGHGRRHGDDRRRGQFG